MPKTEGGWTARSQTPPPSRPSRLGAPPSSGYFVFVDVVLVDVVLLVVGTEVVGGVVVFGAL